MISQIRKSVEKVIKDLGLGKVEFVVEHPKDMSHGDYSTNVAMKLGKPLEVAEEIVKAMRQEENLKKIASDIKVAGAGFINISIQKGAIVKEVNRVLSSLEKGLEVETGWGRRVMVEYAHPNTHKQFHIGHLRNISLGESICKVLEMMGTEVIRVNYQGDVGLHIAKALWGIRNDTKGYKLAKTGSIHDKIEYLGKAYVKGSEAYEKGKKKKEILAINKDIYEGRGGKLYQETRQWSLDYFDLIYKRVGTKYDKLYFESDCGEGLVKAREALKKGILKKSKGAVVFDGSQYGLHTRVFINSEGLATYEAKELGLAPQEFSDFGQIDKNIHVVGPEQQSFFEVTFKVEELLDPKMFKGKQYHKVYGLVNLKGGKMSSRKGQVVTGWWLLEEAKKRVIKEYKVGEKKAEKIAVGAVKYAFLRVQPLSEISFDFKESISLEGNSGPYLQYSYARCKSVLEKAGGVKFGGKVDQLSQEEEGVLRTIYRFEEVAAAAAKELAPNLIANFLFDLAQKYNSFYNQHSVLKAKENKEFRVWLTAVTAKVLKKGLEVLGIEVLERM